MGLFNKFKKEDLKKSKQKVAASKRDLTLAELNGEKPVVKGSVAPVVAAKVASKDRRNTHDAYKVLIKPMITEKGTYLASEGKYLFSVYPNATKVQIKKAVKAVYGVSPIRVNIIISSGKNVRYGKTRGITKIVKKAIVTLKKGETIAVYEGV